MRWPACLCTIVDSMPKETVIDLQGIVAFEDDPWLADAGVDMITLSSVKKMLAEAPAGPLRVRLTSPGGIGVAGNAIASALYERKSDITMEVLGVAASAAAAIAVAGSRLEMTKGSFLMIHDGRSGLSIGMSAEDHEQEARALHQLNDSMADLYADASGQKPEQIKAWMADETWFSAQSAVDAGFADAATPGTGKQAATAAGQKAMAAFQSAAAKWGAYRHLPAALTLLMQVCTLLHKLRIHGRQKCLIK